MFATYIDWMFALAALACGFGLSLATYRVFAVQNEWPMGELHVTRPMVPILIGVFAIVIGFLFAAARGQELGGWWIVLSGILFAIFWTGFMRVASQMSLFLAPIITAMLLVGWIGGRALSDIFWVPFFSPASIEYSRQLTLPPSDLPYSN